MWVTVWYDAKDLSMVMPSRKKTGVIDEHHRTQPILGATPNPSGGSRDRSLQPTISGGVSRLWGEGGLGGCATDTEADTFAAVRGRDIVTFRRAKIAWFTIPTTTAKHTVGIYLTYGVGGITCTK